MIFRYARHTHNLVEMEAFYTKIVGLDNLGEFQNHDNYNGLFLGHKNSNWHIEFTTSNEKPISKYDEDDILVFYVNSDIELLKIKEIIIQNNIIIEVPKNPYWKKNGIMISDPDGYKVVFTIRLEK